MKKSALHYLRTRLSVWWWTLQQRKVKSDMDSEMDIEHTRWTTKLEVVQFIVVGIAMITFVAVSLMEPS